MFGMASCMAVAHIPTKTFDFPEKNTIKEEEKRFQDKSFCHFRELADAFQKPKLFVSVPSQDHTRSFIQAKK